MIIPDQETALSATDFNFNRIRISEEHLPIEGAVEISNPKFQTFVKR